MTAVVAAASVAQARSDAFINAAVNRIAPSRHARRLRAPDLLASQFYRRG
jgi:hypothetical protein